MKYLFIVNCNYYDFKSGSGYISSEVISSEVEEMYSELTEENVLNDCKDFLNDWNNSSEYTCDFDISVYEEKSDPMFDEPILECSYEAEGDAER